MLDVPQYVALKEKALQQYDIAFHLLNVTFPITKDTKILLGLAQNIAATQEVAMEAILNYERTLRLVPPYGQQFASKFSVFQQRSARRHNLPKELTDSIIKLREIIEMHKQSPQEVSRGNRLIIFDQGFRHLEQITLPDLKQHLSLTKELLGYMNKIVRA